MAMTIKTARTCLGFLCFGAVMAALILNLYRYQETRRLEGAIRDAARDNAKLSAELQSQVR
jgi:hypothetical protein